MWLLGIYIALSLIGSFFCSLLEAALLSARNATLAEQRKKGSHGAGLLLDIKQHRLDDALSAVLILNTVANTLGASLAGARAAQVFGDAWVGVFSGAITFVILVAAEITPKTLGSAYSRPLAPLVGWSLHLLTRAMRPVLVLSRVLTRILRRGHRSQLSRGELEAVLTTARSEGTISAEESRIFANLLRFNEVKVEDVMTPRTVAIMLPLGATAADLLADPDADTVSRVPLYREHRDDVAGYVLQRDVLRGLVGGAEHGTPLEQFLRPISYIPELATVGAALRQMLERREPIAMVTDEHGGLAGLVTLEDLTETILGVEIVDEKDRVADMRQVAIQLRDKRLERMRRLRH
ncbi:MAG TPA: hemolysin family protein [Candidatus Polarisedimenticolaceae bacterium]|nr:hemolysin family protein [Candidatus Polarisedimenticolaceae bacterium]